MPAKNHIFDLIDKSIYRIKKGQSQITYFVGENIDIALIGLPKIESNLYIACIVTTLGHQK